ncbi:MAG: murein biosynthesis integral membrane protein MurJ [Zetaproteobacteria bacterium CG_4_9_14_3_um_filter_49_83]|nr:MAG: murein biosynthesis integral membrane protein MurJ [Zetaproteobacteria bacterium CG1_02_49_23]PIQ34899.1 MAG: murein biosynthesis integral membrane protein MurJ [Zetaproteobacteria bacterium CG17_big_fil_post_rev_8_21_14_2_50_50_13]PIV30924.1 MAG: murein biosynthesis integral membrane protein MurJ [Zetaproteobacteria bacterium CG02_land_8_20_14_3_00_50_9]PIY55445.1 MAG: murein biosynthesis integral membrane protein MurJ [Zetaproteobacteria bacterium CG_4_10_14_0_8_um_filter_49_80]PJA351
MSINSTKSNKAQQPTTQSLLQAASTVGSWTMLSRILGFVRDIILARVLGAGMLADAFFVAFKLPNFFRRMFAEGTLTVAMVPVLQEQRKLDIEESHRYLNSLASMLLLILLLVTVFGIIGMPWLLLAFAPGFHDEPTRWQHTLTLARWMFPYLLLISLTAMAWAVLNTHKKFALAAASPSLLNVAMIFAALALAPFFTHPAYALAVGVVLGGVLQLVIQFPALKRIGWIPRLSFNFKNPAIFQTMRLFWPALLGIAAVQINILIGTILATLLPVGAVSYLYYADRIVQLPLALFGIAMGTALLPALSEHLAHGRIEEAKADLQNGLAWLTWITMPALAGILMLAEPIISTLFEQGEFSHHDTIATAQALQAYSIGLIAFCWIRALATACYANKDSKAPMNFAIVGVITNTILAIVLMQWFAHVGLALATSLAAFVNAALLLRYVHKLQGNIFDQPTLSRIIRAALACIPMLGFLFALSATWSFPDANKWLQCGWLLTAIPGSIVVFATSAWLLGEKSLNFRTKR